MFVVNGIKLRVFNQTHHMRKLQCDGATGLEGCFQPAGKVVDVGYMRINVVSGNEVSLLTIGREPLTKRFTKKLAYNGNA